MGTRWMLVIAVVCSTLFALLAVALGLGWQPPGDSRGAQLLYDAAGGHRYSVDLLLSAGRAGGTIVIGLSLVLLMVSKRLVAMAFVLAMTAGVFGIEKIVEVLVLRPSINPRDPDSSFPSGHAMFAVAVAATLLVVVTRHRAVLALLWSAGVAGYGALIVGAGWHYPSDVVGGWLAAAAWLAVLWVMTGERLAGR
jgi:membrane-associated phospholipid phosphatase